MLEAKIEWFHFFPDTVYISPIKHTTFYCGKFGDVQLCVATCRLVA